MHSLLQERANGVTLPPEQQFPERKKNKLEQNPEIHSFNQVHNFRFKCLSHLPVNIKKMFFG